MSDIFAQLVAEYRVKGSTLANLSLRTPTSRVSDARVLLPEFPVVLDCPHSELNALICGWHDKTTTADLVEGLHDLELEQAAQPPVFNVTVTPPEGSAVVKGHFRVDTGPQGKVSWVDGPAPDPAAIPDHHHRPGAVVRATRRALDRMKYGPAGNDIAAGDAETALHGLPRRWDEDLDEPEVVEVRVP